MIILGGYGGGEHSEILIFNTTTETWLEIGSMTKARHWHGVSLVELNDFQSYCVS